LAAQVPSVYVITRQEWTTSQVPGLSQLAWQ
jgi:hypothetical protein